MPTRTLALTLFALSLAVPGDTAPAAPQEDAIALVTVVGCLVEDSGEQPWMLERATDGVSAETAFTNEDELATSRAQPLGTLTYRLLGVGEFAVEPHLGHKVQVKGLKLMYEGERRINVTSFQHLGNCQ